MGIMKNVIYGLFGLNVLANAYYAGAYARGKVDIRKGGYQVFACSVAAITYATLIYLMTIDW